ncbi:hypothetical protein [Nostoc sp.]|uniref:hypothetical protein n=1 Tax=Nostoc sp. TaxID=1180 RepID=UPI002FF87AA6
MLNYDRKSGWINGVFAALLNLRFGGFLSMVVTDLLPDMSLRCHTCRTPTEKQARRIVEMGRSAGLNPSLIAQD